MVSSKRPQSSQRRDSVVSTIARTPPPAFLFPIQRCQRPDRLSPAPLFSAGGRRRRLSSDRPLSCQPAFSAFATIPRTLRFGRKNHRGLPRGFPLTSVAIRLRLGNILVSNRRSSAKFGARRRSDVSPAPSGRRLSRCRPPGCQPILFRGPRPFSGNSGSWPRPVPMAWKASFPRRLHEAADISELGDFEKFFKDLRPRRTLRRQPRPERRRLSSGRPPGCQPLLFRILADPRKFRIFWPGPPRRSRRANSP